MKMNKKAAMIIALLLSVSFITLVDFSTVKAATPTTVATGLQSVGGAAFVEYANQRQIFYSQGLYWCFFNNVSSGYTYYTTSSDGSTWSTPTQLTTVNSSGSWHFACDSNGTDMIYAINSGVTNTPVYFREGALNTDGTITWAAAETNCSTASGSNVGQLWVTCAFDSAGYPWVSWCRKNSTSPQTREGYVTKSALLNGTWETAAGFPYDLPTDQTITGICTVIIPLTNQKMYAMVSNASSFIEGFLWDGSSWGSKEVITTSMGSTDVAYSAVNVGDNVFLAYEDSGDNLVGLERVYSNSSWCNVATIQSAWGITCQPALSVDSEIGTVYCFYANSTNILYKTWNGTAWNFAANSDPWATDTAITGYFGSCINVFYHSWNRTIAMEYAVGSSAPWSIKFVSLTVSSAYSVVLSTDKPNLIAGNTAIINVTVTLNSISVSNYTMNITRDGIAFLSNQVNVSSFTDREPTLLIHKYNVTALAINGTAANFTCTPLAVSWNTMGGNINPNNNPKPTQTPTTSPTVPREPLPSQNMTGLTLIVIFVSVAIMILSFTYYRARSKENQIEWNPKWRKR